MSVGLGDHARVGTLEVTELGTVSNPVSKIHTASELRIQNDLQVVEEASNQTRLALRADGHLAVSRELDLHSGLDVSAANTKKWSVGLDEETETTLVFKDEVNNSIKASIDAYGIKTGEVKNSGTLFLVGHEGQTHHPMIELNQTAPNVGKITHDADQHSFKNTQSTTTLLDLDTTSADFSVPITSQGKSFVDTSTDQTIAGAKTFTGTANLNGSTNVNGVLTIRDAIGDQSVVFQTDATSNGYVRLQSSRNLQLTSYVPAQGGNAAYNAYCEFSGGAFYMNANSMTFNPIAGSNFATIGANGLTIPNMPTSATGLPTGTLYKDSNGFVKVVP